MKTKESKKLRLIKWVVKCWFPGYHIAHNPVRKQKVDESVAIYYDESLVALTNVRLEEPSIIKEDK